jgi:hypothetical protein
MHIVILKFFRYCFKINYYYFATYVVKIELSHSKFPLFLLEQTLSLSNFLAFYW